MSDKKICIYCVIVYKENIKSDELVIEGFDAVTLDDGCSIWNQS